ncbi:hypothetical protein BD626DRAFT_563254 [Schizophyllum amplum]|uniref:Uncharacterized protein n=1 Tax=Schizophyllum amplum TaxID=97359 RepID=A0A550CXM4_9AGAR|nr:hypothetical protein BD626DRAFT_563254 [Auriculariopsis ampla]
MLARSTPAFPPRAPYYPSITLVLSQNGCGPPEDKFRHKRASRRRRCVRVPANDPRGQFPLSAEITMKSAPQQTQNNDDDFLMQTMLFLDEDPWVTYAAELQEALGQKRAPSGSLRKMKRFSALVIDLALQKVRSCAQKLRKTPKV